MDIRPFVIVLALALMTAFVPAASADQGPPNCLQVWPGSWFCEHGLPPDCPAWDADRTCWPNLEQVLCEVVGCGLQPPDES